MSEQRLSIALPDDLVEAIVERVVERVLVELRRDRERRWLTIAEAAVELGLSEGAVRKQCARGGLKSDRIGSRIVVDMHSIGGS